MSDIAATAAFVRAIREAELRQREELPERSRQGMGAALGLTGFDAPRPWHHGEVKELHVRDDEGLAIEAAKLRLQQARDVAASAVDLGEVVP